MPRSSSHCSSSPVAVGGIRRQSMRQAALPFAIAFDHGSGRYTLLTQSRRRSLHAYDDATGVIHQIVVVIAQPRWTAFGRVGRIRGGGRDLLLLWNKRFDRVLLLQFV